MPINFSTDKQTLPLGVIFITLNMDFGHYTYLFLNIASLFFPLAFSFDKRVSFYRKWPSILPAIFITACVFIPWDIWKTHIGVWAFNPDYLLGIWIGNLPLEEWLFFLTIPYAILFIYECVKYYLKDYLLSVAPKISKVVFVMLVFLAIFFSDRMYTLVTSLMTAACLFIHHRFLKNRYAGRFWMTYIFHLIPFFIINGILTSLPVVTYNPQEIIGIRIITVPLEDTIYSMLLLLMNVTLHEYLQERKQKRLNN